ncbi:MAG TPA: tetraacyldisaccharide 4'-kinase [Phycisphaerae bacterium]|nr:tetraacyldisaccharide 4'-kinase [Phycisphaerae bacterium]HNU43888.1 tetraacyldisaccharide 4'-kinase [Phycisphaerae bacterium]
MAAHLWYRKIMSGQAGAWTLPLRAALRVAAGLYGLGVRARNRHYDRPGAPRIVPIPVLSVGNLTAGGTGKTPLVIDLVQRLERLGCNPVVVSRGYGAAGDEPNDEQRLIQRHCPTVTCLADPDRVRAALDAHENYGADTIVLDDGFQHRRLARDLDIVLIDATCPFGFGYLLPRGLLREPPSALRRADVIVISRADQVARHELEQLDARVRVLAPQATHLQCRHRVTGVEQLDGTPLPDLAGQRAVVFAGIGNPDPFLTTVRTLGITVVGRQWWPDHHQYRTHDLLDLLKPGRFPPFDLLLTTEKDAVKLAGLPQTPAARAGVVRVAIDFLGDGGTVLDRMLRESCARRDAPLGGGPVPLDRDA